MADPLLNATMQAVIREEWLKKTIEPILEASLPIVDPRTITCGRDGCRGPALAPRP